MSIELGTAFMLGFLGSLHCIGMCGPLQLLAMRQNTVARVTSQVIFQIARIATYALVGALFGGLGQAVALNRLGSVLSLALAGILLLGVLKPSLFAVAEASAARFTGSKAFQAVWRMTSAHPRLRMVFLGIANALLPCGLVFSALALALPLASAANSALIMLTFGLGTVPALLAVGLAGSLIAPVLRHRLRKARVLGVLLVAGLLLWRGNGVLAGNKTRTVSCPVHGTIELPESGEGE